MGAAARIRVDVGPWRRSRDLRLLLGSQAVTQAGSAVTMIAAPLQLQRLTGSFLLVGLVGAAEFLPFVVGGLWGGAVADARDRRRVVLVTEALLLLLSGVLLVNALLPHPQVWVVFAVAAGIAGAGAVQRPSSDALLPRVVATEDLTAAAALQSLVQTSAFIGAPALGGLIAAWHLPFAYGVDVLSFAASVLLLVRLRPQPATDPSARPDLRAIGAGLRYAVSRRDLLGSYAVDVAAMLFAVPDAVFPFLAVELGVPGALGLMFEQLFALAL